MLLKCKKQIENKYLAVLSTYNVKAMLSGYCIVCNSAKIKLSKNKKEEGGFLYI